MQRFLKDNNQFHCGWAENQWKILKLNSWMKNSEAQNIDNYLGKLKTAWNHVGPLQCTCQKLLQSQQWCWPQGLFTVCFNYILHMTRAAVRRLAMCRLLVTALSVDLPLQFTVKLANSISSPAVMCLKAPLHAISRNGPRKQQIKATGSWEE